MKMIVAPTDFSPISMNAVYYAADLACIVGTGLSLLHVCQIPLVVSEVPVTDHGFNELMEVAEKRIRILKDKLWVRTGGKIKITVEVRLGDVVNEINEYCNSLDVYVVVMGTESAGSVERWIVGGKTITAIDELAWPLMVIPQKTTFSGIHRIGLACDMHDLAETLPLVEISNLSKILNAEFHVIYVVTEPVDSAKHQLTESYLQLQDLLKELNPKFHYLSGEVEDIEEIILTFAENNNLDILILIPKKHGFFSRVLHKRHSRNMVLHSHIPLLSVHE